MPDLVIPMEFLQTTAGELETLTYEFDKAKDTVSEYGPQVGNKDVQNALHDFEDNWKTHREELLKNMKLVYDLATDTHQAFIDEDDELARDIAGSIHRTDKGPVPQ